MFRKKNKSSKNRQEMQPVKAPSKEVVQAIIERNLFDDHGPVVIGNRKDKPKF